MLKAELIGNLGADAEIKSGEGYSFVSMRIANTEKWKAEDGTEHTDTQWIDVVYSKTDSGLLPFLKSGVKVFVRGFVRLRVYSSQKDRKMKAGLTINATEIELCGGSSDVVPRQLVIPETGDIVDVAKYYQANVDTSKWKKDDTGYLVDKAGNQYELRKGGWVAPIVQEDSQEQEQQQTEQ
jgi:single-stranded DNA-binding protein